MPTPNFQFDRTAANPANLVTSEPHDLTNNAINVILLNEGSYYADGVVINSVATGNQLVRGTDWVIAHTDLDVSSLTGREVGAGIHFLSQALSGNVAVTYQAVGGYEGMSQSLISQLVDAIGAQQNAIIPWSRINAPATFPPEEHNHQASHLTELEGLTNVVQDLTNAFAMSHTLGLTGNALKAKLRNSLGLISSLRDDINRILATNGGGGDVTSDELDVVLEDFDSLSALTMDMAGRQLDFQTSITDLENVVTNFMQQLGDQLEIVANNINVTS